jgi:hypothetical protein
LRSVLQRGRTRHPTLCVGDGRLRTEFFKPLPGTFTSIGIIGSLSGLILEVKNFRVPETLSLWPGDEQPIQGLSQAPAGQGKLVDDGPVPLVRVVRHKLVGQG